MKKIISAIALITLVAIANNGYSQTENLLAFNAKKTTKLPGKAVTKIDSKYINVKAKGDFVKTFRNVTGETWFSIPGGYIANFLSNGIDYRITYNHKGKWQYNQLIYSEENLPFSVRDMVKRRYYDFDIEVCTEYQLNDFSVFMLALKNSKTMNTLKVIVANDEIKILTDNKIKEVNN